MMQIGKTLAKAASHMQRLCADIADRSVGSGGNRQATDYVLEVFENAGWLTEATPLQVMDWQSEGATLQCGERTFEVYSSPYSLGCQVEGVLCAAGSMQELVAGDFAGSVLMLHGELAKEQIMPKNFVFYNPESHQRLIATLEESGMKALVCATGRNPELAGGLYPFPLFEDGDFDIPSVYMKDTEGRDLLSCQGQRVVLESRSVRIPSKAYNVLGRKGHRTQSGRVVVTAHVDAKRGTPGALDNATGVSVLLLLAELMKGRWSGPLVELVALNGEDYYAAPGQMKYLEQNMGRFQEVLLNINLDGPGYREGKTSFSPMGLPAALQEVFDEAIGNDPRITVGLPWYQGDHGIFLQQDRPAVAVTSAWLLDHMHEQQITHTPDDKLEVVDTDRLAEAACILHGFLKHL